MILGDLNSKEAQFRSEAFDDVDEFDIESLQAFRKAGQFGDFVDPNETLPERDYEQDPDLGSRSRRRMSGVSSVSSIHSMHSKSTKLLSPLVEEEGGDVDDIDEADSIDDSSVGRSTTLSRTKHSMPSASSRNLMSRSTPGQSEIASDDDDDEVHGSSEEY